MTFLQVFLERPTLRPWPFPNNFHRRWCLFHFQLWRQQTSERGTRRYDCDTRHRAHTLVIIRDNYPDIVTWTYRLAYRFRVWFEVDPERGAVRVHERTQQRRRSQGTSIHITGAYHKRTMGTGFAHLSQFELSMLPHQPRNRPQCLWLISKEQMCRRDAINTRIHQDTTVKCLYTANSLLKYRLCNLRTGHGWSTWVNNAPLGAWPTSIWCC